MNDINLNIPYARIIPEKTIKQFTTQRLEQDKKEPKRRRRTAKKLYEEIQLEGYSGGYGAVNNFGGDHKLGHLAI